MRQIILSLGNKYALHTGNAPLPVMHLRHARLSSDQAATEPDENPTLECMQYEIIAGFGIGILSGAAD